MSQLRHRDYKARHLKKLSYHNLLTDGLREAIANDLAYMDIRIEDEKADRNQFIAGLKQRLNPNL